MEAPITPMDVPLPEDREAEGGDHDGQDWPPLTEIMEGIQPQQAPPPPFTRMEDLQDLTGWQPDETTKDPTLPILEQGTPRPLPIQPYDDSSVKPGKIIRLISGDDLPTFQHHPDAAEDCINNQQSKQ
ncbi:hypothetical protein CF319_g8922 [Tilletia indica]|nr:hypothetical protein CF319_g8922 [Tilletia indica]